MHPSASPQPSAMLYLICDGHSGAGAAKFVAAHFEIVLKRKMPASLPNFSDCAGVSASHVNTLW